MINRREFLQNTTVGVAALAAGVGATRNLQASPYGMPVGIAIYNFRADIMKDVPGTLAKVAAIGYKEVELVHMPEWMTRNPPTIFGMRAKDFAKMLADHGLKAPSCQYELEDLTTDWEATIEQAHELGLQYMTHDIIPEGMRSPTMDNWKRLVDIFNKSAEPVEKAGMTFNYHNHNFEFKKMGDGLIYDYLMKNLNPKIHFTLDCYWATHAGQDPVAIMKAHPGRISILHIKDLPKGLAPTTDFDAKMGHMEAIGRGVIDWKRIFVAAPIGGMKHFYYEQDYSARPPLENAKISFDYLNNLTV